ncbi:organic cation/carnitine transporter 2-like isoform X2 [Phycodurus eques]|uniref:organic cation/carnitine transporter 2-like isoform X2 n=1 Tax=Phycodurus eques TaxID=693459 RepID=UPI002ACE980A|nr:organic cation/carnitine transporter 2-like isoform X2 [Phycodurus eques]
MGDYNEDTAFLGQTGPHFWTTFILLNTIFVSTGFNGLYIVFVGAVPEHRCLVPEVNLTAAWQDAIIPITEVDGREVRSQCRRYKLDVVRNLSAKGYAPVTDANLTGLEQESCLDGWSYSKDIYQANIVTEWDLVCDNQWKVPFASSTLFVGYLLGSLISGQLSDRFGRKKIVFISLGAQSISVLLQSFSQSWRMFCITFLFVGASQISIYISAFVLGTEVLSKTLRVIFTTLGAFLFYCIGYMMLPWIAYSIRDWRTFLAVLSAISVVYIPLWWFIPESPRWLITQGRVAEAEAIIRDAARKNKVEAPLVIFRGFESLPPSKAYTMLDVLRSKNIRCITLMCLVLWIAINVGYFGLSLNTSNLSGNPFMNCFLSATTEVPAYVVSTWLLKRCPRRALLSTFLVIGGGVLLLIQFIPPNDVPFHLTWIIRPRVCGLSSGNDRQVRFHHGLRHRLYLHGRDLPHRTQEPWHGNMLVGRSHWKHHGSLRHLFRHLQQGSTVHSHGESDHRLLRGQHLPSGDLEQRSSGNSGTDAGMARVVL